MAMQRLEPEFVGYRTAVATHFRVMHNAKAPGKIHNELAECGGNLKIDKTD